MRIIAGKSKGIRLRSVSGLSVRPTTDRVKESLFQIIGPYFDGGKVLDLFAGTGSLGLEALSRGADQAIFVDRSQASVKTIKQNIKMAGMEEQSEVYRRDARSVLRSLKRRTELFRLIFLDPPYQEKLLPDVLTFISENGLLEPRGMVVAEHGVNTQLNPDYGGLVRIRSLSYGDTTIDLYSNDPHELEG